MSTITINLPDESMSRVKEQAAALGYADPADYVLRLLEDDLQQAHDLEIEEPLAADNSELKATLIQRLESNDFVEMQEGDFRKLSEEIAARLSQGQRA
jgi:hypothetical protein